MGIADFIHRVSSQGSSNEVLHLDIKSKNFNRNEVITPYNKPEQRVYFLKKGVVEFKLVSEKSNRIIDFYFAPSFFCALTSFVTQQNSMVEIIALTACETEFVERERIYSAYENSLLANKIGRLVIEEAYINKFKREIDFLTKSAEERYEHLIKQRPEVGKEITIQKISQYLGIHPESLSRIRKKMAS